MGGKRFIKGGDDGFAQLLAAEHDGGTEGMAEAAQVAGLLAGQ
jgi:hypothetical protein